MAIDRELVTCLFLIAQLLLAVPTSGLLPVPLPTDERSADDALLPVEAQQNATTAGDSTSGRSAPYEPRTLRVRTLRGRASYVLPEGGAVRSLGRTSAVLETSTGAYLEFGVGTEVELAWNGVGSVRLQGPAAVSWSPRKPEPQTSPGQPTAREARPRSVQIQLTTLHSAEIEARGPGLQFELLREGWLLDFPSGAARLEGRTDAQLRIIHHGGQPIRVRNQREREPGSWPVRIRPGDRVLLTAPPVLRSTYSPANSASGGLSSP